MSSEHVNNRIFHFFSPRPGISRALEKKKGGKKKDLRLLPCRDGSLFSPGFLFRGSILERPGCSRLELWTHQVNGHPQSEQQEWRSAAGGYTDNVGIPRIPLLEGRDLLVLGIEQVLRVRSQMTVGHLPHPEMHGGEASLPQAVLHLWQGPSARWSKPMVQLFIRAEIHRMSTHVDNGKKIGVTA